MAFELIYTSAERGLRPGTRGYCTVAYTQGLRPENIQFLEALSSYKDLYALHHPQAGSSPVAHSHCRSTMNGRGVSILSRVAPALADHTQRSNKMAHHVVLESAERPGGGPAWLCQQANFFRETWDAPPCRIETVKAIPQGDAPARAATAWAAATGDAGWAGALAHAFLSRPGAPATIVYEPGTPILELVAEALALIDPEKRWNVTFNTYFNTLAAGTTCAWRCCVPNSDCLRGARRNPRAFILDLTGALGAPPENDLVRCAREGTAPAPSPAKGQAKERDAFVLLPNRNRAALRMTGDKLPGQGRL